MANNRESLVILLVTVGVYTWKAPPSGGVGLFAFFLCPISLLAGQVLNMEGGIGIGGSCVEQSKLQPWI